MANSAAIIGAPTVSDVTEDTNLQVLTAAGLISISDANAGQAAFKTTVISASGNLGLLTIASNGAYIYSVADSAVQYLGAGDTKIDTFTVTSVDGTTKKVNFTIHGVNDAAVIGTATVHDVTEDATKPTLTASGSIAISDVDQGEATFATAVIASAGNLGTLTLAKNGSYSYSVANSAVQYLGAGDTRTDTFTVMSDDGTTKQISFAIHGVNDAAVIGTPTVHDVTEDASQPLLTANGMISIFDADQGQAAFKTSVISSAGNLGTLTLAANGSYSYSVANSAVQYLGAGDTRTDTFTVTSLDGTTKQVSFTIHGVNDAAVIGTPTVHDVTEDSTQPLLYALGTISISDADQGEAGFQGGFLSGAGALGTLILMPNGAYAYFVSDSAVQYLGANDTKVDTFTVTALDGTTRQVSFTIHGTNDAAVIGTPTVHDVTEDSSPTTLSVTGSISISDADQGQAAFQATVVSAAGNLGTLTLAANGSYSYSVANSATQYLGASDIKTDTFTIASVDGTTRQVTFTIHGVNDAAVIGTPTVHDVTADPSLVTLTATGSISIFDADQGQSSFKTSVISVAGNLGQLTLAANGSYSYSVAESAAAQLGTGGIKVDTFTVTSFDGTTKQVTFTVHGPGGSVNHPATIGDPTVADVTEDTSVDGSGNLTAIGTISISDPDAGQATFQTAVGTTAGNLGSLSITSGGAYTYTVANSATQSLGGSDTKVDTFTVTSADGSSKQVSFTIHGSNDAAVIGDPVVHDVTEDVGINGSGNLTATGTLTVVDPDQNQNSFQTAVGTTAGNLGSLSITSGGAYTYTVANSATQSLGASDTRVDTFTVTSVDGTPKQVSFTIHGSNDAAVIGDPAVHDVTEDVAIDGSGNLTATGTLTVADPDQNQNSFQTAVGTTAGNLGSLTITSGGAYTYTVANSATQSLGASDTRVDTFTVTSVDGTPKQVTFTIHGSNDAAVIGDPVVHDVTEDLAINGSGNLTATGTLTVADPDQNQNSFQTAVGTTAGNLGSLSITSGGAYTYTVANSATQSLGGNDTKVDTFTVTSVDGTPKQVTFTIHGSNDAAVIGDPVVHDVTEDLAINGSGNLTATGTLTIADPDQNQNSFQTAVGTTAGNLGSLSITSGGAYTYTVANSATQSLGGNDTKVDTFTVTSVDGTPKQVTFTIHGSNDAAVIGDPVVHDVTEGLAINGSGNLTATGTLTVADPDQNQNSFQTAVGTTAGNLGSLTITSGGAYTYTVANSATQSLGASDTKVDTFTVTAADGTPKLVSFTIHGSQDAPTLSVATAAGNEDSAIPLSISSSLIDSSATESLSLTVTGVPAGAALNHGSADSSGIWHLSGSDLAGLTITPALNFSGSLNLSVTATSTDSSTAGQLSTTQALTVNVAGVADAPTLTGPDSITVNVSTSPIPLGLFAALTDNSETLGTVTITGVPSGYVLSSGSVNEDGDWFVAANQLAGLALQPADPTKAGPAGNFHLHVTATSIDGASVAAASIDVDLHIDAGLNARSGRAFDGYVSGATVFADANGNGVLDAGEVSTTTAADGTFTLNGGIGTLVMVGGTDVSTGLSFLGTLSAPSGSTVITPLTTLVAALTNPADPNDPASVAAAVAAAQAAVASAFGLDPNVNLQTFDPVAAAATGDANATSILAAGIQVQTTIAQISAAAGSATTQADVVSAVASSVAVAAATGPGTTIDLTQTSTLTSIIHDAAPTVADTAIAAVSQVVSEANAAIATAASGTGDALTVLTNLAQAATVALGQTTDQLAAVDINDTNALATVVAANTGGNLTQAIAAAPVGDPDGSQVGTLGNDTITGAGGNDVIDGLDGNDTLSGLAGNDTIRGGNGNDIILGGDGNDNLDGGDGKDILTGGAGDDIVNGGTGFDRASYVDATGPVMVNLAAGTASGAGVGNDTLIKVEGIVGSNFADHYDATGFTGSNEQPGSPLGFNEIEGMGGDDFIIGAVNAQGQALTRVSYVHATGPVTVDIAAGTADGDLSVGHDTFSHVAAVWGSAYNDTLLGSDTGAGTFELFEGRAGNDFIDGRGGYDRVDYNNDPATLSGIVVHLAAGTVTGDSTVGTDTLRAVEAVRGTNFDDVFDATGFGSAGAANVGSLGTFNDFSGMGGNDTIIGNGFTRLNYTNAAGGITADLETTAIGTTTATTVGGTATGLGEGTDTFTGVNAVLGSTFDDTFYGSSFNNTFTGLAGNDYIDGRGGFDIASYNSLTLTTGGVTVNLAAGTATGDASIGSDTLRSIEGIQGTNFVDTFIASGYGQTGATNVSNSNGSFNQFEGLGGDDLITGNGNTRIGYFNAAAGVTVVFTGSGSGTATGDASVGQDTFTGVNSVTGSAFADSITGDGNSNTLTGGGGNDTIDGSDGADLALFTGVASAYTIALNTPAAGQTRVTDSVAGRDGTDTLSNIEVLQFSDRSILIASSSAAAPIDVSDNRLFFGAAGNPLVTLSASTSNDFLKIGFSLSNHVINLGGGTGDTVILGQTGGYNLNLQNVENLTGSAGNDSVNLVNNANGLVIDLGAGTNDVVNLANGTNVLSATNVENINATDFTGTASNDVLTLSNNVSGLSVNLAQGNNTLNLAAGANSFTNISNAQHINGSAGDDTLTISNSLSANGNNPIIDLGAGNNTLTLGAGGATFTALNIQHLNGSGIDNFFTLNNNVSGMAVDLGGGVNDTLNLAIGANIVSVANVENVNSTDFSGTASNDTLTLSNNVSGLSVSLGQGINTLNLATGTNQFVNISNVDTVNGSAGDDILTVSGGLFTPNNDLVVNMGDGNDTLNIGAQSATLGLVSVEHLNGDSQNNSIFLTTNVTGLSVDLGAGNDTLGLANGVNSISAFNVESIGGSDWTTTPSDDTLSLLNDVSGVTVNLGQGANTLNLTAGSNAFVDLWGIHLVNGSSSNDTLAIQGNAANTIDLGGGTDTLILGNGFNNVTVRNVESVVGGTNSDNIMIADLTGTVTVTGGLGNDFITAGGSQDNIRFTSVADSAAGGGADTVANFDAASDAFVLDHVAGLATEVHFVGNGAFDGTPAVHQSEARLAGNVVQIDVDGDGQIGAGDMEIVVNGLNGNLTDANFVSIGIDHAPTNILLSAATVAENSSNGSVVGALSAVDPDAGDSATFSLTNNAGGRFAIANGNLVVNGPLDFEAASSQQVTVRVTDSGGLTYDKNFVITVTDVNEAPTAVVLSNQVSSTAENGGNIKVADIAITDDALGTNTLSLSGADAAFFSIVNGSGGPELHFVGGANFEAKASYDVTVNANDASASNHVAPDASQSFHLAITDVNEAPAITSGTTASVAENAPTSTIVYQAVASDPDTTAPNNTIAWTLSGTDAAAFNIDASGHVTLKTSANYEAKSSYNINVIATDGGAMSASQAVTVSIIDVNEAPTAVVLSGQVTSTAENGGDVKVADIAVADDILGSNVLSLSGADATAFTIVTGANGKELHFNGGANFEAKTSYDVTVNVNDATASNHVTPDAFQNFHLAITNVNEAPTDISLSSNTVPQTTPNGTVIGALSAVDPDAGDTATFTLVSNPGNQFAVSGGNLVVAGALTAGSQQITVRATDALGLTFDKVFNISVNAGATIVGDAGDNSNLTGTAGNDTIQGLDGNDTLQGLAGDDLLDGGNGQDLALYSDATAALTINMAAGTVTSTSTDAGVGTDTLRSIEAVQGSNFNDTYSAVGYWTGLGTPSANQGSPSVAGPVNNTFEGMGGNDSITGNGRTTASYFHAANGVTINLSSGSTNGSAFSTAANDAAGIGTDTLINVTFARGSEFADVINGGAGNDVLIGGAGNDALNGGGGFDLANYSPNFFYTVTGGITVTMSSGSVVGNSSIGTDTLRSIESVRGTSFADTYVATNFGATGFLNTSTNNVGNNGTFNEFEGMGGDDGITGNNNTRILYVNASAAVTVDLVAGTARGTALGDLAQIGTDTISGIAQVRGSSFDDTLLGSNTTAFTETFEGWAGNDLIDGRGGFDIATYANNGLTTSGINANMTTGTVVGDSTIGTDTLRGIEGIQGTALNDTYVATNFGATGFLNTSTNNVGNNGTFNQFEGLGGDDNITGNGNTRIIYSNATVSGVTINLQAGTATGATVGNDTFVGVNSATGSNFNDTYKAAGYTGVTSAGSFGLFNQFEGLGGNDTVIGNGSTRVVFSSSTAAVTVNLSTATASATGTAIGTDSIAVGTVNAVTGSNFADSLTGGAVNENFQGGGGDDAINGGGGGNMATYQGTQVSAAQYTVNLNYLGVTGQIQVIDNTANRDGTDVLNNIQLLQFSDSVMLAASGTALNPIDISGLFFNPGTAPLTTLTGSNDDYLAVGGNAFGHQIDLGAGNDTVSLAQSGGYTLNLVNVENVKGTSGDDFVTLTNAAAGLSVDLGAGTNDFLSLASGPNSLSVAGVETLNGSDFGSTVSNDVLTLLNNVSGMSINLGNGTNTVNLAAGANTLTNVFGDIHLVGTASDDTLTISNGAFNIHVDLGAGGNDILNINGNQATTLTTDGVETINLSNGAYQLTANGVQTINGSASDDTISFATDLNGVTVNLGAGSHDSIGLANGTNSITALGIETISGSDFTSGITPSNDTLSLLNDVTGVTVNLGDGTNTLNLAAGSNSFDNLWGVNLVNGTSQADTLTLQSNAGNTVDLGDGNDTLNLNGGSFGITVANVETINGSANYDNITISNAAIGNTTITAGAGADAITASAGQDNFRFANVADSTINGQNDTITNFDAVHDTFTFAGITVAGGSIDYVGTGPFEIGHASAVLQNVGPGNDVLNIDIDGSGTIDSADIVVNLISLNGTLHSSNFLLA